MKLDEKNIKIIRIVATVIILIIYKILRLEEFAEGGMLIKKMIVLGFYLLPYLIIGYDVLMEALIGIRDGMVFDECFLMMIATLGALILFNYTEAVAVLLFYQIGELFEDIAMTKSEKNIEELMDIRPDIAYIEDNNEIKKVNPKDVPIGSIIVVKNGERIPIDGEVIEGQTLLNTLALTGESIPKQVKIYDEVLSGMINTESTIKIKTTKLFEESTASKIIELVKNASDKKSKSEKFITEFAKVYTPVVCIIAVSIFIIPVIINFLMGKSLDAGIWIYRALTMLVISCPCSLVVSIPLAFFSSVGRASKYGILIKGTNFIEALAKVKIIVFDKTGTMTKGVFEVVDIHNEKDIDTYDILKAAAYVEYFSNHPIAKCIKKEYDKKVDISLIKDCKEIGGYGLSAYIDNHFILVGSNKLMKENSIDYRNCEHIGTIVHVAIDGKYQGHIVISDIIKPESKESLIRLKKLGIEKTIMLTGDAKAIGEDVAKKINIDEVYTELLPQDKLNIVDKLLKLYKNTKKKLAFVGDGINDAPALVRSDVGISMGSIGSDSAVEASDVVLMDDNPIKIATAIKISKKTMIITYEIIVLSLVIKIALLIVSAMGISNMWFAVFADVGVLIICVINAIRLLFIRYN